MKLFDIFKKNKLSYLESEQLKKYPEKIEIVNFNKKLRIIKNITLSIEMNAGHLFIKLLSKWNMNDKKITNIAALLEYSYIKNNSILNQTNGLILYKNII